MCSSNYSADTGILTIELENKGDISNSDISNNSMGIETIYEIVSRKTSIPFYPKGKTKTYKVMKEETGNTLYIEENGKQVIIPSLDKYESNKSRFNSDFIEISGNYEVGSEIIITGLQDISLNDYNKYNLYELNSVWYDEEDEGDERLGLEYKHNFVILSKPRSNLKAYIN